MSELENTVNEEIQNVEQPQAEVKKETKKTKPVPTDDFDWSSDAKKHDSYKAEDRARMEEMYEKTMSQIGDHEVIEGTVVAKTSREVVVNIGFKSDALTYHAYDGHEENSYERVKVLRSLCQSYNPAIQMNHGETGTQSRSDGAGALKGGAWTPLKQAKYLARHMMSDFFSDVMFASYFSCMDMIEALNGTVGDKASYLDYGYFGVLGASFDENGVATGEYTPKPSYYAMQTIASIFREDFSLADLPVLSFSASSPRLLRYEDVCRGDVFSHGFRKPNGSAAYVYWKASELLTTTYESTISFEVSALPKKMELIDLVDGTVYEIPEDQIEDYGYYRKLLHLPLRDYPLLLTFGDFR